MSRIISLPGSGKSQVWRCARMAVTGLLACAAVNFTLHAEPDKPIAPRQLYNEGTHQIGEKKLREAETALHAAVASQNDKVQEAALYNLGEVRFQQGAEELKKASDPNAAKAGAQHAGESGDNALRAADEALKSAELESVVSAYMQGKGARKELKAATEAVKKAMESKAAVLTKWRRASGDFKSAYELRPADQDAKNNAEVVDRSIAKLVDQQMMMMPMMAGMKQQRSELGKKMSELKKKMPADVGKQMKGGEEDDDEEEDKPKDPKEPKEGQQEGPMKEGKQMQLSFEEAERMLDMLRLDSNRKLPLVGENPDEPGKPKDRKRRDW